ncbi:MAG: hypothetical protein U0931_11530 [Vulcanimicrobiota bacterium]
MAVNDYNLGGAEGFDFGKPGRVQNTVKRLSEFLIGFVRRHPRISPPAGGRIVPLAVQARLEQGLLSLEGVPQGAQLSFIKVALKDSNAPPTESCCPCSKLAPSN